MSRALRTQEGRRKHKKKLLVLAAGFFIALSVLAGSMAWVSRLPSLTIAAVEVEGAEAIEKSAVEKAARDELSGNYYFLFARANAFLYPRGQIAKKLAAEFPRAETLDVSLKGLDTLKISLTERKPAYLFCKNEGGNECYFADKEGYVFGTAPSFSGDAYLTFIANSASSSPSQTSPIGAPFLSESTFRFVVTLVDETKKLGLTPQKLILDSERSAVIVFREGWEMKFFTNEEEKKLFNNMSSIAAESKWGKAMRTGALDGKDLLYFDFRFGNKVYYKFE